MKVISNLHYTLKINLKQIIYSHVKVKTKLLDQKIEVNLHDFGLESRFLDMTSRSQSDKGREEEKRDYIKSEKKNKKNFVLQIIPPRN